MFFEGSEKKVEIVIKPGSISLRSCESLWERVVANANATILSKISNSTCDAYLLSESSLFVYEHRVVMITCGRTSLVDAVEYLLLRFSPENILLLMFERKNERLPHIQPSDFKQDTSRLSRHLAGKYFRFGSAKSNYIDLFYFRREFSPPNDDMTLEILMHDLAGSSRSIFCGSSQEELHRRTAIHRIFDGYLCDDHVFEPMGYSLNALKERSYYTVHVTPQKTCSYASFETSHVFQAGGMESTLERLLQIFQPQNFSLLFFQSRDLGFQPPSSYALESQLSKTICGYKIRFCNFHKIPSLTQSRP